MCGGSDGGEVPPVVTWYISGGGICVRGRREGSPTLMAQHSAGRNGDGYCLCHDRWVFVVRQHYVTAID